MWCIIVVVGNDKMKVVITGGCKGLGLAFTRFFAERGDLVYAFYNKSIDAALELENEYTNVRSIKCDIRSEENVDNVFFNISEIDILINNAGIARDNYYKDKSKKEFMSILETNVVGTFLVTKYAFDNMKDGGVIINISSDNTIDAYTSLSMDYDASKAGVNMLTKDFSLLALEEKRNVKIIGIAPGWIDTDEVMKMNEEYLNQQLSMHGQKKLIKKEELVKCIFANIKNYKNGDIIEIKNLEGIYD